MKPYRVSDQHGARPIVAGGRADRALREHWIAGAGLDVFEQEPLPSGNPLRDLDNVILAPHGLAWTEKSFATTALEACDNILTIARGESRLPSSTKKSLSGLAFR